MEQQAEVDFTKIPFSVRDILFEDEREFRISEQLWFESSVDGDRDMQFLCDAVSCITKLPSEFLKNEIPFSIPEDPYLVTEEEGERIEYTLSFGDEISLLRLYLHCDTMMRSYEPEDAEFSSIMYKGEEYFIKSDLFYMATESQGVMTAGELVEVMQLQEQFDMLVKMRNEKIGDEENGELITGAYICAQEWLIGRQELAILLKKKGEKLPSDKGKRVKWISDRAEHFKDISLKTVMDVRFFLIGSLVNYRAKELLTHIGLEGQKQNPLPQKPKVVFPKRQI